MWQPYNGEDEDCDAATPDDDLDGDGYVRADDCDDSDPALTESPVLRAGPVEFTTQADLDAFCASTCLVRVEGGE